MKVKILFILFFSVSVSFAQRPKVILPGQTETLSAQKDTLWVVNNKMFKKTIITKKHLDICQKQVDKQKELIAVLKKENSEQKILIDTLKSDRDFYKKNWQEAENDVKVLTNYSTKYQKYFKIALVTGAVTTVAAFAAGFLIAL